MINIPCITYAVVKPFTQEEAIRNTSLASIQRWALEEGVKIDLKSYHWKSTGGWSEGEWATRVQAEQRKWICLLLGIHLFSLGLYLVSWVCILFPGFTSFFWVYIFFPWFTSSPAHIVTSKPPHIDAKLQHWPGVQRGSTWRRGKLAGVNRLWSGTYFFDS